MKDIHAMQLLLLLLRLYTMLTIFSKKKHQLPAPQKPLPSLAACIFMDFIGYATYAIPFFGEFLDILWAPMSAVIFFKMFGGYKGFFGGIFNFVEEIMPGLDFIPTFTIVWFLKYSNRNKNAFSLLTQTK